MRPLLRADCDAITSGSGATAAFGWYSLMRLPEKPSSCVMAPSYRPGAGWRSLIGSIRQSREGTS